MYKSIVFDLDGTLGNTLPLCIAAFRRAVEPFVGREISDREIIATFGPSEEGTIMALAPDHYAEALESYIRYYGELHDMCPEPFPGVADMLQWLKDRGVRLAMVTGKGRRSCDITLERFGIGGFFEIVGTGSPAGQVKTEGIVSVLEYFGIDPKEALYVGDAPSDVTSSRKAGVGIAAAAWAPTADVGELEPLSPDAIFTSIGDFRRWLGERLYATGKLGM